MSNPILEKSSLERVAITISAATQDGISGDAQIPLLDDAVVVGSVDYKWRPALRSRYGGWKSSSFILIAQAAERFSYYGVSSNMISYLTGELGQSTGVAAANLNSWYGMSQLSPIIGAFLADSFLGRYRMILVSNLLYIVGLVFLSISAALNSPTTNSDHSQLPSIIFFISLYLVGFAQGGFYPCVQAFGADQFDDEDQNECKAKSSFFNWYNCFSCVGSFIALLVLNYIQENMSWVLGFGIPSIVMFLSLILFSVGTMTYRYRIKGNGRNPFGKILLVFVNTARNWQLTPTTKSVEDDESLPVLHQENGQFKFLDKALLAPDGSKPSDRVCSIDDVRDAKAILKLVPIWISSLGYALVFSQPSTLFTKQASTMDRHIVSSFQIPAASLQLCITVSVIVFIPIYDRIFVPIARALSAKPSGISMLQRIGIGFLLSLTSIVFAAVIERKRLATAREYGLEDMPTSTIPMSVWWLAPQYLLSGIGDVFAMVGLQEFFYDQVPFELKSVGVALYLSILGIGSLLSSFLVCLIGNATSGDGNEGWFSNNLNRAHLDYFYWVLAGISTLAFASYIKFARSYVYSGRINP